MTVSETKESDSFSKMEILGQGGFGIVYLYKHKVHGRVALKKIEVSNAEDEETFQNERRIHEGLNHPNIVKFVGDHNVSTTRGLFLEYLENGNVIDFMERFIVPWQWKTQIAHDVSLAMWYLHDQQPSIIHGDLKPKNLLIDGKFRAKVSDFGLACCFGSKTKTTTCEFYSGHRLYVAPECLENTSKHKTVKFDVYGYGISMWEIFSEKRHVNNFEVRETISEFVIRGARPPLSAISMKYEIPDSILRLIESCWDKLEQT